MPLLIAYKLISYKSGMTIVFHGVEQEITSELFDEIVSHPSDYTFSVERLTAKQKKFADNIELFFKQYIDWNLYSKNRMKALHAAIFQHYKSVSKFARTTKVFVSEATMRFRQLMEKNHTDYSKFVLKELKDLTGDYEASYQLIVNSAGELESATERLAERICQIIAREVGVSEDNLLEELSEKYTAEWKAKQKKSFDYNTNAFLDIVSKINEKTCLFDYIKTTTKRTTGLEFDFWSDQNVDDFQSIINSIIETLNNYNAGEGVSESEVMITISGRSGNKSMVFDDVEIGDIALTAKNKISSVFDNFGLSVSHDEKVQIILSILNELMEGK